MNHLDSLNDRQREAVLKTEGPVLILAGAGAGKTKTITHRILHLIKSGIKPSNILAITFTNKAAKEMRERVFALIKGDKELNLPISFDERPFVSTFHSLGVHIIKENAHRIGLTRHFTIFDRSDSRRAIKEAVMELGLDPKQYDPSVILSVISREKGNGIGLDRFQDSVGNDYMREVVWKVWQKYEAALRREKALDFDDLLLRSAEMLEKHAEVRTHYEKAWKYVHIDEYQDTNKVQYKIARLISGETKNICVVGDVDQNIYSWRGADIKNILNFERDYPGAAMVTLEENYRSTQTILEVANHIIQKNKNRFEKNLYTRRGEGDKILVYNAFDENDEARFVAEKAAALIEGGTDPREIAVLYRANFQSRALEEAMIAREVPYQVLGVKFFERKEVRDALSYIRAALNRDSLSDLQRVINVPARGIGKVTIAKIFSGMIDSLSNAHAEKWKNFNLILDDIAAAAGREKPSDLIKFVLRRTGLEDMLKAGTDEDLERLENVRELATLATKYDFMMPGEGVSKLLEDAALATDQDEMEEDKPAARMMTVHASKGLEFEHVFITGLEQDLFPHRGMESSKREKRDEEEERRLYYVALTRAKKRLYLSHASMRTIFGSRQVTVPSEFVFDIPEKYLETEERARIGGKVIYFDI
ncbi:MAG TPA: UvrD-helicase domain-containing protein [Candidatus Paceibacterota bacterium]|nr:UvrD-helicase domain-containing protein [Candidatus Paceibacterota bacterium]